MAKIGLLISFLLLPLCFMVAVPAHGAEKSSQKFKLNVPKPGKRGNLFNLFFETPPPLPTARGTLIINAFLDQNGNKQRDPGEQDLRKEISCRVDGVDYAVPAFIPGLKYNGSYQLVCTGTRFQPRKKNRNVLIENHGEIIRIDLACRPATKKKEALASKPK